MRIKKLIRKQSSKLSYQKVYCNEGILQDAIKNEMVVEPLSPGEMAENNSSSANNYNKLHDLLTQRLVQKLAK